MIASLSVIVHCTRCGAIRVVFLCGRFVCTVVFLLCSTCGMQGLCSGDEFGVTALKGWEHGGFMAGQVLARPRRSY